MRLTRIYLQNLRNHLSTEMFPCERVGDTGAAVIAGLARTARSRSSRMRESRNTS